MVTHPAFPGIDFDFVFEDDKNDPGLIAAHKAALKWTFIDGEVGLLGGPEQLGFVPGFLHDDDERPLAEQINERYVYGGWRPQKDFDMRDNGSLKYPGDPVMKPYAFRRVRREIILAYPYGYFAILQQDGSFEAARLD